MPEERFIALLRQRSVSQVKHVSGFARKAEKEPAKAAPLAS
jgi:hypothetical protein